MDMATGLRGGIPNRPGVRLARSLATFDHALARVLIGNAGKPDPWQALAEASRRLVKARFDDPVHPAWPAGAPGGRGGKYRPKRGPGSAGASPVLFVSDEPPLNIRIHPRQRKPRVRSKRIITPPIDLKSPYPWETPGIGHNSRAVETLPEIKEPRLPNLDALRTTALDETVSQTARRKAGRSFIRAAVVLSARELRASLLNLIPVVGDAVDIAIAIDEAVHLARELIALKRDADVAISFQAHGPYSLEELRVSDIPEGFGSPDAFEKILVGELLSEILERRFGPAGIGQEYHHLILRSNENVPINVINNTATIVRIPKIFHEQINSIYESFIDDSKIKYREWVVQQSPQVQYEFGLSVLRRVGILK